MTIMKFCLTDTRSEVILRSSEATVKVEIQAEIRFQLRSRSSAFTRLI